jgi:DNA-binding transcriptional ArsR family regulator
MAGTKIRIIRILRTSKHKSEDGWVSRSAISNHLRNVSPDALTAALEALRGNGLIQKVVRPTTTKPAEWWRLKSEGPENPAGEDSVYSDYSRREAGSGETERGGRENPNNANSRNATHPEAVRITKLLQTFTAEEVEQFRREVAEAGPDDLHAATDREALALLDALHTARGAA